MHGATNMTLTLDEVRRVRFRMARRGAQGYEVTDVDNFVDKVEESFNKMTNDAELLQRQIESLQNQAPTSVFAPSDNSEEQERLRGELENALGELDAVRGQLESARAELDVARSERDSARGDADSLRAQRAHMAGDDRAEKMAADMQRMASENERILVENDRLRRELDAAMANPVTVPTPVNEDSPLERLIVTTSSEASPAVVRLVQLATEQAEQVVLEADGEARRKLADAERRAFEITTDARTKADRVESEARVNAEKVTADATAAADMVTNDARSEADRVIAEANQRANRVDRDTADRRAELFASLERERDDLLNKVDLLRGFETTYRENLTKHLQSQLEALQHGLPKPIDLPEFAV
ncbi:MAG: hypothetical protein CR979_00370, partial [Propionibacterium sp.]